MSNYSALKQDINNNIYENQTQQITGTVLNAILNEMTNSLGAGYQFAGVATLGLNPGDPDQRVFYLAGEGIYTNFGGLQVPAGKLGVLKWDNRWTLQTIDGLGGGGANLTGYVSLASADDLPDEGQPTLGYLCGTNLYLYVGEGGDTKEGKYQDCGSFRGPEGAYIQDIEQTETSHENGGRNTIKMTLSDGRSFNAYVHNGTTSSGLFPTVAALQAAYPSPVVGQYAFVGAGFPADIYVCTTAGTWTDSGEDYDGDNVDLTNYATKDEVSQLQQEVTADISQLEAKVNELAEGGETASTLGFSDFSLNGIYKTTDDTIGTNANYKSTPLAPVTPGTVLKWSGFPVANDVSFVACFYDANNAPVAVGSNNRLSYGTIKSTLSFIVPSGVSQVGFTWNNGEYPLTSACVITIGDTTPVTLKDAVVEDVGERLGIQDINESIQDINESIQDINESIQDINFVQKNGIALGTTEDGPIDVDGGLTSTSSSYKRCIIPNAGYVRISGHGSSYAPRPVLAFYNSATPGASSFISGIASTVSYEDKDFDVQIPEGTVTIIVSWATEHGATAGVANLYTTQEKVDALSDSVDALSDSVDALSDSVDALSDSVDALVENVRPITVTPADFTATGLWKADIGEIDATKTNYSAIPQLLDVIEGQTIKFHNWQKNYSSLDSVAAIFCYDNDGLPFNGSSARKNYGNLTTFNYETGEYTFVVPSNCSYVGLAFNFVTIPLSGGGSSIEVREGDIALTDKAKELINNAVETGEQVGDDSAKYYLKGNSNIMYSSAKKLGIIAAGQSNIDGRNSYSDLPAGFVNPNAKVRFCNNVNGTFADFQVTDGGANNDWSFDAIVYNLLTDSSHGNLSDIYVMKKSMGGTSIDPMGATSYHWTADYEFLDSPSASLLRSFEEIVRAGIASNGTSFDIKAMLWHQGEGDMQNEAVASRYYENLKNMLAYVRGVVGNPRLYFFCGNISLNRTSPGYVNIINAAYTKIASEDPYFKVVDMSNAQLEDGYHFNYQWSIYFGQKVYDLMIDAGIISGTKINPSEPS